MKDIISIGMTKKEDNTYDLFLGTIENENEILINLQPEELSKIFNQIHNIPITTHRYNIGGKSSNNNALLTIDSDTAYVAFSTEIDEAPTIYKQTIGQGIFNSILPYIEYEHVKAIHKEFASNFFNE